MQSFRRARIYVPILLLTGCVSVSSAPTLPPPTPEPSLPTETIQGERTTSWRITPTNEYQKYSSLLTTVIGQVEPAVSRRDSLVSRTLFSISLLRSSDTMSFSGSITGFTIRGSTLDSTASSITVPISFKGKLVNHNISTRTSENAQAEDQNNCQNSDQSLLKTIQRNILITPLVISAGQTWTDSISSVVCNGTLPATQTVIRTLTVLGESDLEGFPVLILTQNERTFSKGEGSLGQHRIIIESQGLTTGRVYLDRSSGQLLAANSTNRTSLSVQSSGRTENFIQNSTEVLERVH